jgi:ATP-dependent RNA helicase DeaD
MSSFENLGIRKEVVRAMDEMGWTEPTPVQMATIPVGLSGSDLFAQAQTGTGKTGTYGSIVLGMTQSGTKLPSTLILAPTRELALQVSEEIGKLSKYTGHRSIAIYGGVNINPQISELRRGIDIVIGTPGRCKDLIDRGDLNLSKISIAVLDEADRMLDMGFIRDIDWILGRIPKKRQMMLFSATMSSDIKKLAMNHMVHPKELLVSKDEIVLDLTSQYYMVLDKDTKRSALCTILDKDRPKTIVFGHTKRRVNQLTKKMVADGYRAGAIHGNVSQNKREKVVSDFKKGDLDIMIATDVAARGLDIDDVDCVVNYDMPDDPDTYVHRIGRTGRAGKVGTAVSFVLKGDRDEADMLRRIQNHTGKPIDPLDIVVVPRADPEPQKAPAPEPKKAAGRGQKRQTSERKAPEGRGGQTRGQSQQKGAEGFVKRQGAAKAPSPPPMKNTKIYMNLGSDDKIGKSDIVAFIRMGTGLSDKDVGRISLGKSSASVEVPSEIAKKICSELSQYDYQGKTVNVRMMN